MKLAFYRMVEQWLPHSLSLETWKVRGTDGVWMLICSQLTDQEAIERLPDSDFLRSKKTRLLILTKPDVFR